MGKLCDLCRTALCFLDGGLRWTPVDSGGPQILLKSGKSGKSSETGTYWDSDLQPWYGLAVAPFSYLLSFLFAKHTSAQILSLVLNFLTGLLLMLTSYILNLIKNTKDVNESLMWIYRLFPGFCLGHGLFEICTNSVISRQLNTEVALLEWDVAGKDAMCMYILAPSYFFLTVLIDFLMHSPLAASYRHLDPVLEQRDIEDDPDVAAEAKRIEDGGGNDDVVRLEKLRKVYRTPEGAPKVAVQSLTFGLSLGRFSCQQLQCAAFVSQWWCSSEKDMPAPRPSHSSDDETHVVDVTKTDVLKEVFEENEEKVNYGGKAAEIQAVSRKASELSRVDLPDDPVVKLGQSLSGPIHLGSCGLHSFANVCHFSRSEWLSWWGFDTMIGMVILANAVVIGMESQARAWMPLGCSMDCDCKDQVDPTQVCTKPSMWLTVVDYCFYTVYLTELVLRFAVYGVMASTVDIIVNLVSTTEVLNQVMLVRLLRLARLARALRLMVQFQTLWQLVQGLFHSIGTLFWTFLLVMLLMYIAAVTGMELIKVDQDLPVDHPYNAAASLCFDSIGGIYRPLVKQNVFCFVYFVLAMLILSIALMNLVTAVMVNSSLDQARKRSCDSRRKGASQDKEAKKAWEAARKAKQMENLKKMFLELDEDGSGELSLEELLEAPESAQDQELFGLLDYDGGGTVGVEEFCEGVLKASSAPPGAMELTSLVKQCADILHLSKELVNSWGGPAGVRAVAEDIILNAVREVRALRALSAGLGRASASAKSPALPAGEEKSEPARGSSHAGLSAKAKASKEKSHDSDYTYEYETDTEGDDKAKQGSATDKRPAEEAPQEKQRQKSSKHAEVKKEVGEDQEKSSKRTREKGEREEGQRDRRSERRREEEPPLQYKADKKEKDKKKKKTRRGGRKHKRLERLAEDPYIPVHRGLSGRFLDEKPRREYRERPRRQ
eukprot:s4562_g3.t1